MIKTATVVPIPPSYGGDEKLELDSTNSYISYLTNNGINTVMTTAGTSQFNLLSEDEIHSLNCAVANSSADLKILGIPILSTNATRDFITRAQGEYIDNSCRFLVLYPDRYYDNDSIIKYFSLLRELTEDNLYLHCMPLRSGRGGTWNYSSTVINQLYEGNIVEGIKEEHSTLKASYDFVYELKHGLDVIVAGGSMRRHQFLKSAGANSFLAGVGNIFPSVEVDYVTKLNHYLHNCSDPLLIESRLFSVFMKLGWHRSLRESLRLEGLTCENNRSPWPKIEENERKQLITVLNDVKELIHE